MGGTSSRKRLLSLALDICGLWGGDKSLSAAVVVVVFVPIVLPLPFPVEQQSSS